MVEIFITRDFTRDNIAPSLTVFCGLRAKLSEHRVNRGLDRELALLE